MVWKDYETKATTAMFLLRCIYDTDLIIKLSVWWLHKNIQWEEDFNSSIPIYFTASTQYMIASVLSALGVNQYKINLWGTTVILNAPPGLKLPLRYSDSSRQWDAQARAKVLVLGFSPCLAELSEDGPSHWCTDGVEFRGKSQWTLLKHPRYLPFGLIHCGSHQKREQAKPRYKRWPMA